MSLLSLVFRALQRISLALCGLLICACSPDNEQSAAVLKHNFCENIHRNDSVSLSSELAEFSNLMKHKTGVYVLEDGGGSLVTRAWLCEYAEKTIDIQYFIFSTDNVGLIACDYLVRAADRGIKVRILVDDIMVDADIEDILKLDAHENIEIKVYNPGMNLGKNIFSKLKKITTDFRSANQRMHNKTFTVDGNVVITGGRNVADEYFDYDHEYNFRDREVLLIGRVVTDVTNSFTKFWNSTYSISANEISKKPETIIPDTNAFESLHQYACDTFNFWPQIRSKIDNFHQTIAEIKASDGLIWVDSVYFVSDLPGKNDGSKGLEGGGLSTDALIELVNKAKSSIDIQSPYLITTKVGQLLFKQAVDRGVKIRILTNSLASTDNIEAFSSYQKSREALLKTGIRIFEFRPDAVEQMKIMTGALQATLDHKPIFGLHAKTMVIDGKITVIGTFNLDPRSANLNTECVSIIHSQEISQGVLKGMNEEFKPGNSWETTLNFNPDKEVSRFKRVKTWTRKILPKNIL